MTTNSTQNAFPQIGTPFVDPNRVIGIPWYRLLISLWNRTGGSSGGISTVLDNISSTQGTLLYRGGTEWSGLPPATNGQALFTGGPSANPSWRDVVTSVATAGGLTGGPITTTGTVSIADGGVTNAKLAQMAALTLKGNATGALANPTDLTVADVKVLLNFIAVGDAAGGSLAGTYPNPSIAAGAVGTTELAVNGVTNAKLAQMATSTIKGNLTAGLADPSDVTVAALKTALTIGKPYFLASLTTNQAIVLSTVTKVAFNSVVFDSGGYYDLVNNRYLPLVAGVYEISAQITCQATSPTQFVIYIYKNGSATPLAFSELGVGASSTVRINLLIQFNGTTDYIDIRGYIAGSVGPSFIGSASSYETFVQGKRIGDL